MGPGQRTLPVVHPVAASRYAPEIRPIHQACGAGMRAWRRMDAPAAIAARGRGAQTGAEGDSRRHRESAQVAEEEVAILPAASRRGTINPMAHPTKVSVIDSHTGGEPTRVVIDGGPDLGGGTVADRLKAFREQHDRFRSAVVNEPRGSDVLVG